MIQNYETKKYSTILLPVGLNVYLTEPNIFTFAIMANDDSIAKNAELNNLLTS